MKILSLTLALILTLSIAGVSLAEELGQEFWQYNERTEPAISGDEAVGQEMDQGILQEERVFELQSGDEIVN